jgi:hypothetical protein
VNKSLSTIIVVFVVLQCMQTLCFARFEIHPRLSLREEFNDNVFLNAVDKESDFITTAIPGLGLNWIDKAIRLNLDYSLEFRKYLDNDSQDQTQIKQIQRGLAFGEIFPDQDFSIEFLQAFYTKTIDERLPVVSENSRINTTNVSQSIINPQYRHQFTSKFIALLDYRFENLSYESSDSDDVLSHSVRMELKRQLSPRLEALVGGDFGTFNNSLNEDYNRQTGYAGFSARLSQQLALDVIVGESWIDFDHQDSEDTFVGDVLALFDLSRGVSLGAGWSQDFGNATDDGVYLRKRVRIVTGWNLSAASYAGNSLYAWRNKYSEVSSARLLGREIVSDIRQSSLELNLDLSENQFYSNNREDKEQGLNLAGNLYLGDDWHLLVGAELTELVLNPGDVNINRIGFDTGFEYLRLNYTFSLRYFFREDDSEIDANDFQNNIVFLQAAIQF